MAIYNMYGGAGTHVNNSGGINLCFYGLLCQAMSSAYFGRNSNKKYQGTTLLGPSSFTSIQ